MEDWFCPLSAPSTFAPSLAFGKWFVNSTGSPMQRWHSGMRDRAENEWERERGRSILWCAASTEEQAVLCPSPTLRHKGERNEWMRDEWEEGGVERMDGDFCPLLYEWLYVSVISKHRSCCTSPRKIPCPAGPIMSVLIQFSSVSGSWFCGNSDSMWLSMCVCFC